MSPRCLPRKLVLVLLGSLLAGAGAGTCRAGASTAPASPGPETAPAVSPGCEFIPVGAGRRFHVRMDRLQVALLFPGSSAEAAGLQPGDVLLAIAGRDVPDRETLQRTLLAHCPGDRVEFLMLREGTRLKKTVVLQKAAFPRGARPGAPCPGRAG